MCYCYIIYSQKLNRFYTGSTILSPEKRLERHNNNYYGNKKFTANANDWKLFYSIKCTSLKQAKNIETHIKRMKSKKYIRNLKIYPEITERLLQKYKH
jgi:putative endonuclease